MISNTTASMMMYYLPSSMSSLWAGWEAAGGGGGVSTGGGELGSGGGEAAAGCWDSDLRLTSLSLSSSSDLFLSFSSRGSEASAPFLLMVDILVSSWWKRYYNKGREYA